MHSQKKSLRYYVAPSFNIRLVDIGPFPTLDRFRLCLAAVSCSLSEYIPILTPPNIYALKLHETDAVAFQNRCTNSFKTPIKFMLNDTT